MEQNNKDIILSVKNLNVYFKSHGKDAHVIRGIDLDIVRNECFAIVGESGSGKSVFTKTFTGMIDTNGKVKNGSIILNGVEVADPKIVRRRFRDIRRFETVEKERYSRSATALGDKALKKAEADFKAKVKAVEDKSVKIDRIKHIEYLTKLCDKKYDKKFYYVNALYSDKLNQAFNKGSRISAKRQRKIADFEKYLHFKIHEADFGNDDHSTLFSKIFEEKLQSSPDFIRKDNLIKTLEEEKKQFAEGAPGRVLINKKIAKLAKEREVIYLKLLNAELRDYIASQKPTYPANSIAYKELLEFLKAPLAKMLSGYELSPTTLSSLNSLEGQLQALSDSFANPSPRSLSDTIRKAVSLKDEQLKLIAIDYKKALSEDRALQAFSLVEHDEIYDDIFDSVASSRYVSKSLKALNDEINDVLDQLNKSYFSPGEQEQLQEKLRSLEKKYAIQETQHIGGCIKSEIIGKYLKSLDIAEPDVSFGVLHLIRTISDKAAIYLSAECDALKENNKILINQLRFAKEAAWTKVEDEKRAEIEGIEKNTVSNEEALKKSQESIKALEEAYKIKVEEITKANKDRYEAYVKKATLLLEDSTLSKEEKIKFADYDEKDLLKIVSAQKTIDILQDEKEKLQTLIDSKLEEIKVAVSKQDLATIKSISKEIQFEYRYFEKRLAKESKDYEMRLKMIEKKLAELGSSDVDKRRKELLLVEKASIESSHLAFAEQIKNEILKALKTYSKENNSSYSDLQNGIHEVKYAVKKYRSIYRKLRQVLSIKKPMLAELRDNGVIRGDSINLAKLSNNRQWSMIRGSHIATIFQDPMTSLNPLIKIGKQITDVLILHHNLTKKQAREEAIELLRKVHIPNPEERFDEYPFQYSGGMRQRVVIAIALACRPDILICDEPTTALDVTVQAQILALIKELQKEYNFTIIFITHDLGVVAGVADRIGVMYGGQIIEYGTDQDIFYNPAHPYTWALLSSLPQLAIANEPLVYIRGNPPVFTHEIEGDSFAPRSDYAMRIDYMKEPPMFQISETHFAKTWLLDPRAPKVKKPTLIRNLSKRMEQTANSFLATSKGE